MGGIGELLEGLASLAWPALMIFLAWRFAEPIRGVIESAKGRKFTIKVGDNELSMEEATAQQRRIVADLQEQVAAIVDSTQEQQLQAVVSEPSAIDNSNEPAEFSILWVDDNPSNNSFEIANLEDRGFTVTTALSTDEALVAFRTDNFDRVISDMGRRENGRSRGKAGIELTKKLRDVDSEVPIIIYCGGRAARALRSESLEAGANEITSSPTTLLRALRLPR